MKTSNSRFWTGTSLLVRLDCKLVPGLTENTYMEESYQPEEHSPENQLCCMLGCEVDFSRKKVLSSDDGLTLEMEFNFNYICTVFFH